MLNVTCLLPFFFVYSFFFSLSLFLETFLIAFNLKDSFYSCLELWCLDFKIFNILFLTYWIERNISDMLFSVFAYVTDNLPLSFAGLVGTVSKHIAFKMKQHKVFCISLALHIRVAYNNFIALNALLLLTQKCWVVYCFNAKALWLWRLIHSKLCLPLNCLLI